MHEILQVGDRDPGLFHRLAHERRSDRFAGRHLAAHQRVPQPGVGRFARRALLRPRSPRAGRHRPDAPPRSRGRGRERRRARSRRRCVPSSSMTASSSSRQCAAMRSAWQPARDRDERRLNRRSDAVAFRRPRRSASERRPSVRRSRVRCCRCDAPMPVAAETTESGTRGRSGARSARARARAQPVGVRHRLPANSASSPASSSTANAERLRLGELASRLAAGDDVVGLLRHRSRDLAAERLDHLLGVLARERRQRAGEDEGLAGERLRRAVGSAGALGPRRSRPAAARR